MREQFEKLPDVILKLEHAHFVARDGVYYPNVWDLEIDRECAEWLDGAWYAFQEQQKKIDSLLDKVCGTHEDFMNDQARD